MRPALLLSLAFFVACGDETSLPSAGTVTLFADQGIDFHKGRLRDPGNFENSDLFATANGDDGLKLSTGGASPIDNRPITWFRTGGGFPAEFAGLASVPTAPAPTTFDGLIHARQKNGFLLLASDGDLVHGWLSEADGESVTLQWERVLPE